MIFAIDFDGTIVDHEFPLIGEEKPKAVFTLKRLQNLGNEIIIWTCREGPQLEEMKEWLAARDFFPDAVNENTEPAPGTAEHKIYADVYIDDKNFPPFQGWQSVLDELEGKGI